MHVMANADLCKIIAIYRLPWVTTKHTIWGGTSRSVIAPAKSLVWMNSSNRGSFFFFFSFVAAAAAAVACTGFERDRFWGA